jgi:hypothetical protein
MGDVDPNPYASPKTGNAASGEAREKNHFSHDEQADLFVATLAPLSLKVNVFTIVLASCFVLLFSVRLMIALVQTPIPIFLEVGQILLGLGGFFVARFILRGSTFWWIVGLVVCPLCAIASFFALATGSIGGLFCGFLSVGNIALLAVNFPIIKRIGSARDVLRSGGIDPAS